MVFFDAGEELIIEETIEKEVTIKTKHLKNLQDTTIHLIFQRK